MSLHRIRVLLPFVLLLALGACGEQKTDANPCLEGSCSGHGTCSESGGAPVCACESGYAGERCEGCADGFQDKDADGSCLPACTAASCGSHGVCADAAGTLSCVCDTGWAGDRCTGCAVGFHADEAGACVPDGVCQPATCSGHGVCTEVDEAPVCACEAGYAGARCTGCAAGFQDKDADGSCLPDCASVAPACVHGACSDAGGTAVCACVVGYAGALCEGCAAGYQDNDGDGACLPACGTGPLSCGEHGACADATGVAACVCSEGYAGPACAGCANGYQDNDADGTCLPRCGVGACGGHGTCSDSSGAAVCTCAEGYEGLDCQGCVAGYQDNDLDGSCEPGCSMVSVDCGAHGQCSDASGAAMCECDAGYSGATCACGAGTQDNDNDGVCQPTCAAAGLSCGAHGACGEASGTAVCVCEIGYEGASCGSCASGYEPGTSGDCVPASSCGPVIALPLVTGTVSGSTTGQGDDYEPACISAGSDSEDVVYIIQATENAQVAFQTSGYDTVLTLSRDCSGEPIACNDDNTPPGNYGSRIEADLTVGTYYLIVDGYQASGSYTLSVQVIWSCAAGSLPDGAGGCVDDPCDPNPCSGANTHCERALPSYSCECDAGFIPDPLAAGDCMVNPNPQGESCSDPIPLQGQGAVTGSTVGVANTAVGDCAGDGPDRVYAFTAAERTRYAFMMSGYDTVLHLRSACATATSEIACNDDSQGNAAGLNGFVDAGTYYLFADSYSNAGSYTLDYSLRTDPCAGDPCPGTPECVAAANWGSFECVCPAGTLPHAGSCVDDPCEPNLCTQPFMTRCVPELASASYRCDCNSGYIPDGAGGCEMDPNANEWTFLVYLNGDNNLDSYGDTDLAEMQQAGSNAYVNIIVLHDSSGTSDSRILQITPGGQTVLQDRGEVDMGDWQTLRDFGVWGVQNFPARHYALVLWNHGEGWRSANTLDPLKAFSNDDHGSGDGISIANGDYAQAMLAITQEAGGKLDLVGFDACLMGMYEVAKATEPFADYLVASSETEPADGWAYHNFLPGLVANHTMNAETLGRSIVDSYYADSTGNSTQALTRLDTLANLDLALSNFANELRAVPSLFSSINTVRSSTQAFYESDHRDLQDFAERIAVMSGAPAALVTAAQALVAQLQLSIVHNRAQTDYPGANGLAIYLPSTSQTFEQGYLGAGATWSQSTTWDEFLQDFAN